MSGEPAWLIAKIDQRLALIKESMPLDEPDTTVIMTPLAEPIEDSTPAEYERWDMTCDNCGRYVPDNLWTGHAVRVLDGLQIIIVFGVCGDCKEAHDG